jgi:Putative zinc-finger
MTSTTASTKACVSEPMSWLALERYHLGELAGSERDAVAKHVAACGACSACLAHIEADDAIALPPLTLRPVARPQSKRGRRGPAWATAVGALAAAAAAVLVLGRSAPHRAVTPGTQGGSRVKGGDVAFALVRDDGQRFDDVDGVFRDGERFKVVVTCPASERGWFDLVVFDAEGASFPLEAAKGPARGNDVPLPGAFRLTGRSRESVCLVWSDDGPVDRARLARSDLAFASHAACKELDPEPDPLRSP